MLKCLFSDILLCYIAQQDKDLMLYETLAFISNQLQNYIVKHSAIHNRPMSPHLTSAQLSCEAPVSLQYVKATGRNVKIETQSLFIFLIQHCWVLERFMRKKER